MTEPEKAPAGREWRKRDGVPGSDEEHPEGHTPTAAEKQLRDEIDPGDEDGLPDGPAKHRVPS